MTKDDPTLVEWILEVEPDESKIEGIVIGKMGWGDYNSQHIPNYKDIPKGVVLDWKSAKPWISYKFSDGFGAPECNAIYVWTTDKVMFISQYDGSTTLHWVPRNPIDIMPGMPGG